MKLHVLQENLEKYLNFANKFTSNKAQLPVLANIKLSAKNGKLSISSTNLEISYNTLIGAKVKKEGEITVPANVICDIVSNLNSGPIELSSEKENLNIKSSDFSSLVSGMNSSDFPKIPEKLLKDNISLSKKDFVDSLMKVLYSVSTDETRPVLTGVLFIFDKDSLIMVATDGFRLSRKRIKVAKILDIQKMIIPKSVLFEMTRLVFDEEDVKLSFSKDDNQVIFAMGSMILSSRVIEGNFPDFEKVIPKEHGLEVTLDKEELSQAIKLASVFARDSANMIKFKVKKNILTVSSESQYSGKQEKKRSINQAMPSTPASSPRSREPPACRSS